MGKKRKRVSTPSHETLYEFGYNSLLEFAQSLGYLGPNACQDDDIVNYLCDGAAERLMHKFDNIPVAQWPIAFEEIFAGMFVCALLRLELEMANHKKAAKRVDQLRSA